MSNTTEKKEKQSFGQFIKFALFSASAGIIQVLTFTLLSEVVIKLPAIQSAMESNATFARIMQNEYGPMYLTALILSVVWNFTFNRKFTFKSAANVPVAMLKVFAFYLVFTPISTLLGNYFTAKFADVSAINYIVLGLTMATNMITEFLYDKFVVFRGQENTAVSKKDKKKHNKIAKRQRKATAQKVQSLFICSVSVQHLQNLCLRANTHGTINRTAVPNHQQSGNTGNAKGLGQLRLLVHIHLAHLGAGNLCADLIHNGRHHTARAAPGGPKSNSTGHPACITSS